MRTSSGTLRRREALDGVLFAAPAIIGLAVFILGPVVASLFFSMTEYNIVQPAAWAGLDNYVRMMSEELFWTSLYNTAYYSILSVPLSLVFALAVAMLLNQKVKGQTIFRTIFYLPSLVSGVAVAIIWMWIFNPFYGLLNIALEQVGIIGPLWLQSAVWSKPALVIMHVWSGTGSAMIIFLAALQGVPEELYEAARIDGAGSWKKFRYVTLPMISPVTFFNLIMGVISGFQVFTQAYVMTQGGPLNSTLFYVLYLYRHAFIYFEMGYASALSWVLLLITVAFTALIFRSSNAWVFYSGEMKGR